MPPFLSKVKNTKAALSYADKMCTVVTWVVPKVNTEKENVGCKVLADVKVAPVNGKAMTKLV